MKLSVVIPVLNQYAISAQTLNFVAENSVRGDTEIVIIDNASNEGGKSFQEDFSTLGINTENLKKFVNGIKIVTNNENAGNYPIFNQGLKVASGDIIAYIHSDFFIYEKGWDERIIQSFENNKKLGLLGFVGSYEIDALGGRGMGTMTNFQGKEVGKWKGSPAYHHGATVIDLRPAVVLDGCSMVFRRSVLNTIGVREIYPPHHFYDRLMSCQVREAGYQLAVLGIQCDHISGQTANTQTKYADTAKKWFEEKKGIKEFRQWREENKDWIENGKHPTINPNAPQNYDQLCYLEAERIFLTEYRDIKHLVPFSL